ncbi:FtsX-like permease family protein [Streptomyces monticola]|uniref:FtsX-like permease family protein n=1 Tax=Streptomyces monticola TaxID=2666263 RepID=A0ABW2JTV2_9ACTN
MLSLAMRSIRQRPGRFLATLLSAFLGAAIIMTFNSMHDTAAAAGVDDVSAETLTLTASVVGGYGTLLVFFAIASTLTVNVRQREQELLLLRNTGATPAQIKRMVVGEAVAVALAGALLAIGPAMLGGQALLQVFKDTGQVAESVDHTFGTAALMSGIDITLLAAVGAAFLAVRRATRAFSGRGGQVLGRWRVFSGKAALGLGAVLVLSAFVFDPTDEALMAGPAYGAILIAVGCAVFSPRLLRALLDALDGALSSLAGASGYLTVRTMRPRVEQYSGILMPLILFTGMATATLTMQSVENDEIKASGLAKTVDAKNLETLNLTVVGIIVAFCCVMLINTLYAATSYRSREFGQQRLAGATPGQVLGTVATESAVLTAAGVFFGTLAALAGTLPFTYVRTDGATLLPDQFTGVWFAVVAVAAVVTLVTSVGTARKVMRTPAVETVALAA